MRNKKKEKRGEKVNETGIEEERKIVETRKYMV